MISMDPNHRTVGGVFRCSKCGDVWEGEVPAGQLQCDCEACGTKDAGDRISPALPPEDTDVFGCECSSIMFVPGVDGLYCVACGKFTPYVEMFATIKPKLN